MSLFFDDITLFATNHRKDGTIIGIDFGQKRIGIAISDFRQIIATPLVVLPRQSAPYFCQQLLALTDEYRPVAMVFGQPTHLDGYSGNMTQASRDFAKATSEQCQLPTLMWEERLTTVQSQKQLRQAKVTQKKRQKVVDSAAAALILQSALDRLKLI